MRPPARSHLDLRFPRFLLFPRFLRFLRFLLFLRVCPSHLIISFLQVAQGQPTFEIKDSMDPIVNAKARAPPAARLSHNPNPIRILNPNPQP